MYVYMYITFYDYSKIKFRTCMLFSSLIFVLPSLPISNIKFEIGIDADN